MSKKGEMRLTIEQTLIDACVDVPTVVYIDKSKSGWRIKFVMPTPNTRTINHIRKNLRLAFPDVDTRVWYINNGHTFFEGLAIKIFN